LELTQASDSALEESAKQPKAKSKGKTVEEEITRLKNCLEAAGMYDFISYYYHQLT
jgi:hypothetical protein